MFWDSTGCYAIGNYIMVRAPGWAIAERLCFDKNGMAHIQWRFIYQTNRNYRTLKSTTLVP